VWLRLKNGAAAVVHFDQWHSIDFGQEMLFGKKRGLAERKWCWRWRHYED